MSNTLEITASRQFTSWLYEQRIGLVFTTYQAGKIFWLGLEPSGQLSVFERTLERCMGLFASGTSLYISTLYQLWRFENSLAPGELYQGYDALYAPQMSYITGDLDIHDVVVTQDGELVFVNTLFSCLATVSPTHSFAPWWQPPFITKLAAEDRCHLNGLALREGRPRYVSSVSRSDVTDGWRERRRDGGCVIDIDSNEIIVRGLSMPHSPRWHQDRLWLLNSGTGEFGYVDLQAGRFEPVCFCPGYQRGLAFHGNFAIIGLSQSRQTKSLTGLVLDERLAEKEVEGRCGLVVVDLKTGDLAHSVRIEGVVTELYDVATLPHRRRPMGIGFRSDEIRRLISVEAKAPLS